MEIEDVFRAPQKRKGRNSLRLKITLGVLAILGAIGAPAYVTLHSTISYTIDGVRHQSSEMTEEDFATRGDLADLARSCHPFSSASVEERQRCFRITGSAPPMADAPQFENCTWKGEDHPKKFFSGSLAELKERLDCKLRPVGAPFQLFIKTGPRKYYGAGIAQVWTGSGLAGHGPLQTTSSLTVIADAEDAKILHLVDDLRWFAPDAPENGSRAPAPDADDVPGFVLQALGKADARGCGEVRYTSSGSRGGVAHCVDGLWWAIDRSAGYAGCASATRAEAESCLR